MTTRHLRPIEVDFMKNIKPAPISLYFGKLGAHAKFWNHTSPPSGILVMLLVESGYIAG